MRASWFTVMILTNISAYATTPAPAGGVALEQQTMSGASVSGTCGRAVVHISGVERDPTTGGLHIASSGALSIVSDRELLVGPGPEGNTGVFLQDRNKIQCLHTPAGPRIILAMYCDGRACAPVDYRIIDANTAEIVSAPDQADECDARCARMALGVSVPKELAETILGR